MSRRPLLARNRLPIPAAGSGNPVLREERGTKNAEDDGHHKGGGGDEVRDE